MAGESRRDSHVHAAASNLSRLFRAGKTSGTQWRPEQPEYITPLPSERAVWLGNKIVNGRSIPLALFGTGMAEYSILTAG
jgi:hypothetical protein